MKNKRFLLAAAAVLTAALTACGGTSSSSARDTASQTISSGIASSAAASEDSSAAETEKPVIYRITGSTTVTEAEESKLYLLLVPANEAETGENTLTVTTGKPDVDEALYKYRMSIYISASVYSENRIGNYQIFDRITEENLDMLTAPELEKRYGG